MNWVQVTNNVTLSNVTSLLRVTYVTSSEEVNKKSMTFI